MLSVVTNAAADDTLRTLSGINSTLAVSQQRLTTGKKIASAKDDGAGFIISKKIQTQQAEQSTLRDSLLRAQSVLDVTQTAASDITDIVTQMKAKALMLTDTSLDANAQQAIKDDLGALSKQLDKSAKSASFNGINLLTASKQPSQTWGPPYGSFIGYGTSYWNYNVGKGTGRMDVSLAFGSTSSIDATIDWGDGTQYVLNSNTQTDAFSTVASHVYDPSTTDHVMTYSITSPGGFYIPGVSFTQTESTQIPVSANGVTLTMQHMEMTSAALGLNEIDKMSGSDALAAVDKALSRALNNSSYYGTKQNEIAQLITDNTKRSDALEKSYGDIVDADLSKEAATLQATQTRQSLATQSLSMANSAPRALLSLFQ